MNAESSLDRESFQALLGDAFAVQESGLETQSLSAFVAIQRMIGASQWNADLAMQLIADRGRAIANASGVAIALLQRDQLVYCAGSGSAARHMGRQLPAVLSVSAHNHPRKEILRVENAQTDTRIAGAICRQFGAMALLILPIYCERTLAGVLEVLFDAAHVFQPGEVRAYQLMAVLIGDVLSEDVAMEEKTASAFSATGPYSGGEALPEAPKFLLLSESVGSRWLGRISEVVPKLASQVLLTLRWNWVAVPALLVLAVSSWVAYEHQRPSPAESAPRAANQSEPAPAPVSPRPAIHDEPQSVASDREAHSVSSPFQRVRIGKHETDNIADDVTIRHFTYPPASVPARSWHRQIEIGEDVTVHYFASTPAAAAQLQPASAVQTSGEPSLPMEK